MANSGGFGNATEIFELAIRISLDDAPREPADAAIILGETKINTPSLLGALVQIWGQRKARQIGISAGYALGDPILTSFEEIKRALISDGIPEAAIIQFPLCAPPPPPSTDAEAIGLVPFAKIQGWDSILLVTPPLHQFRAFVSTVSAILKVRSGLQAWNLVCDVRGWDETMLHSQSAPVDRRWNLLAEELKKIERYYAKGDHVPAKAVLDYMNARYK